MEFIEKYARFDGSDDEQEISVSSGNEVTTYSDDEFIDDRESIQGQDPSDYRLKNVIFAIYFDVETICGKKPL